MIFLSSPYTDSNPAVIAQRVHDTKRATYKLISRGNAVFSPIVHCHDLAYEYGLPSDQEFWWEYNRRILRKADELWVLMLEDWERSAGVDREIQYAQISGIPITYLEPRDALL